MKKPILTFLLVCSVGSTAWADFLFKAGSFSTGTGAATTTIPVTGVGFQGKALLLFWNGRTGTTDAVGRADHYKGIGVATASDNMKSSSVTSQDADGAAGDTSICYTDANVICMQVPGSVTVEALASFTSWDSDGFTLTVNDAFPSSRRIGYCVWGGSDVTNVTTYSYASPTSNGSFDVTTVGFQPDIIFNLPVSTSTAPPTSSANDSRFALGVFDGTHQGVVAGTSDNGATTTVTRHYAYESECGAVFGANPTGIGNRESCTSMLANGFRMNHLEGTVAFYNFGLAMKGGKWLVGNSATRTDTTPWSVTGLGATPKGGIVFSSTAALNAQDTPAAPDSWSMGAFSATNSRVAMALLDENDIANNTEVETSIDFDEVYDNISTSAAIQGQMDVSSIDADGVTWVMDDADPGAAGFIYVLFGASSNAVPVLKYHYDHLRQ